MAKKEIKLSGREKERQRRQEKKREQQRQWMFYAGMGLLVIAGLAIFSFATQPVQATAEELAHVTSAHIDGSPDAPVQIVEFGDFGCPACRQWHQSGVKQSLKDSYGESIAFTFRHFPVITADSPHAAEAGLCAAEQDAFWPYHDYLYEHVTSLGNDQLLSAATATGLQLSDFQTCLDSGKYQDYVQDDLREARNVGARGTPTFMVNGQLVANPSFETMSNVIFSELNR